MAVRHTVFLSTIVLAASVAAAGLHAAPGQFTPSPPTIAIDSNTRLLVVAPHPDDEALGAGGLMQRVREAGGAVQVVYLTDGDGYPEGVRFEGHVESPRPADYRGYGRQRQREARAAMAALGFGRSAAVFLSFPDEGLSALMRKHWSERRRAFRSPYTGLNRPPKSGVLIANAEYRGEDLTQELAQTLAAYRPTLVLVPRKEDQHPDHCASWFFLMDALAEIERVQTDYAPEVLNYIVHWYSWPFEDAARDLIPPPGLRGGGSGWIRMPLTIQEQRLKRAALKNYRTQMHVMSWFLDGFARSNEVFSRPASTRVALPIRRNICG